MLAAHSALNTRCKDFLDQQHNYITFKDIQIRITPRGHFNLKACDICGECQDSIENVLH